MRLALKLILAFTVGNVLLACLYGYLAVRREVRMFRQTASVEAETLGRAMEGVLSMPGNAAEARACCNACRRPITGSSAYFRVRWVWFDRQPGDPDCPEVSIDRLTTITIEQHVAVEAPDPEGTPYLHVYWPVSLQADRRGGLEFSHAMAELADNEREIVLRTAGLIGGMVLLSGLLRWSWPPPRGKTSAATRWKRPGRIAGRRSRGPRPVAFA